MLDRSQPHGQVFGISGVSWEQDGQLYDGNGHPVTYRRVNTGEVDGIGDPVFRTVVDRVVETLEEPKPVEGGDLEGMHWRYLSAMLAQYDQPYTTKEAAIAFLRGKQGG